MTSIKSAQPKPNLRIQAVTIAAGQTAPAAGEFFLREHFDFIGIETDANFGATKVTWYAARTYQDAVDGNWSLLEWQGATKETAVGAAGSFVGDDPLHFTTAYYLRPVLDAAQVGSATVITGRFRQFS